MIFRAPADHADQLHTDACTQMLMIFGALAPYRWKHADANSISRSIKSEINPRRDNPHRDKSFEVLKG